MMRHGHAELEAGTGGLLAVEERARLGPDDVVGAVVPRGDEHDRRRVIQGDTVDQRPIIRRQQQHLRNRTRAHAHSGQSRETHARTRTERDLSGLLGVCVGPSDEEFLLVGDVDHSVADDLHGVLSRRDGDD